MAKYWKYLGDSWRLPAETDIAELRARFVASVHAGELLTLTIEMGNDPLQRTQIVINRAALPYFAAIETDDQGRVVR